MRHDFALAIGKPLVVPDPAAAVAIQNAPRVMLVSWSGAEAKPVELALYAEGSDLTNSIPGQAAPAFVGDLNANQAPPIPAFFTIEYGLGGIVRRRIVDAYSARLYLGVCDNVRVFVTRWKSALPVWVVQPFDLLCSASIAESSGGSYDELTSTVMFQVAAASAVALFANPPSGAYAWEAGVCSPSATATVWGTAQPDIFFGGPGLEEVVYRLSSYQIVPPFRRLKAPYSSVRVHSNAVVLIADLAFTVRWFLNS